MCRLFVIKTVMEEEEEKIKPRKSHSQGFTQSCQDFIGIPSLQFTYYMKVFK